MSKHRTAILLFLLLAAAGCRSGEREILIQPESPGSAPEAEPVLRSYTLPSGRGQQVSSILSSLLYRKEKPLGRAALTPDGQLVVVAPTGIQEGLDKLLSNMGSSEATAPPTVAITYWLVVGRPASEPDATRLPAVLQPMVDAVLANQGPMELALLETMTLRSLSDATGRAAGRYANANQVASVAGDKIVADISLEALGGGPSSFSTRLSLPAGKLLVLGQAGFRPPPELWPKGASGDDPATLFYVIRADIEEDAR